MEGYFSDDKSKLVFRGEVEVCREYDEKKDLTVLEFKEKEFEPKIGNIIVVSNEYMGVFNGFTSLRALGSTFEYVCNIDGKIVNGNFFWSLVNMRLATPDEIMIFKRCLSDQDKYWDEGKKEIKSLRATGRTTRLVDYYVQELFNNIGKFVSINDHYSTYSANLILFNKICKRLESEHPNTIYSVDRDFKNEHPNIYIKIIK